MSQSVVDSLLSEQSQFAMSHSFASSSQHQQNVVPHPAKILLDSGYRSTTSNSALEEELAAVERQRRAEREKRRQQQQQQQRRKPPPSTHGKG
jgi:hypothetical protein